MFTGPEIVATLGELGVSHVIWVPDTAVGPWEAALESAPGLSLIRVCREGEAWPLAAGLHLGGQAPLVVMQTTGLFESGDALRNVLYDLKLPIFSLVGVRNGLVPESRDSAKLFAEPIVQAWGIDAVWLQTPDDKPKFAEHYRKCRRPAAGNGIARGRADVMTIRAETSRGMPVVAALQVLIDLRSDEQIVVTNQGSARIWPQFSQHPLDLHYNPSTMGGAIPLALGLALAQPSRHVLVVSGEGSLLMSLGCLVTVAAARAANLSIVVLDNGRYEVTGGQQTPATNANVDWVALARGAGFRSVAHFAELADWQTCAPSSFFQPGPRFVSLEVQPVDAALLRGATVPIADQLNQLQRALSEHQ